MRSLVQIWLPALGTLYFTIAGIWHLPYAEEVVGTIVSVDTFLGVSLRLSDRKQVPAQNPDGRLVIDTTNPERETYLVDMDTPLEKLPDQAHVVLNVVPSAQQ